jgi:hypothetical protein
VAAERRGCTELAEMSVPCAFAGPVVSYGPMTLADETDALYGLQLDEFTAARNELARRLRREGHREQADEVAALRKPSLSAWAVNRLARDHRADVRALLEAAEAIKEGRRDGVERFREAADVLVRAAREVLSAAGRTPSDTVLREVATTLRAAAATEPDLLAAGRLTHALESSGFAGAHSGVSAKPVPRRRDERAVVRPPVERAAVQRARRELAELRSTARKRRREAAAAAREAQRAHDALDDAERRVGEAERRLAALRSPRATS